MASVTYFNLIDIIQTTKKPWKSLTPEEKKAFEVFMINRSLSMIPEYLDLINYLQTVTGKLDKEQLYSLYCEVIPKKKTYAKYIKNIKSSKYKEELIDLISNYFECNKRESNEYLDTLFKTNQVDEIRKILSLYGKTNNQINNLIK